MTTSSRFTFLGLSLGFLCLSLSAQPMAREPRRMQGPRPDGQLLFKTYCASCHGATGVGNGPAATSLRRPPPDLTALALANGGLFPAERVRRIVDGREVEAHGNREMPVWGDAFSVRVGYNEDAVRARIAAIVQYLASIQKQRA